jgi:nucleoside-diphosphate-sugar epimerase
MVKAGQEDPAILVTGASGYAGYALCRRLRAEGERVVALDRKRHEGPWERFVEADLSREEVTAEAFPPVKTIYHLASGSCAVNEGTSGVDWPSRSAIVGGTRRMIRLARALGETQLIYFSGVEAMGGGNPVELPLMPMDESWPHTPQEPYGRAMAEAEQLVRESGLAHAVVLRPVEIYGPGSEGELGRLVGAVRRGRFPPLPETGNRLSLIHIDDLVEFALRAAQVPLAAGKTYILSAPEAVSTREIGDAIRDHLGKRIPAFKVPNGLIPVLAWRGSLLNRLTGYRPLLDRGMLARLTRSAWYTSRLAEEELKYRARRDVLAWIRGQSGGERMQSGVTETGPVHGGCIPPAKG